jgi:hypothetical protein
VGEIVAKLSDAASMFWAALDEHERRMLLYVAAYFAFTMLLAAQQRSRERLKAELRAELHGDGIARGAA